MEIAMQRVILLILENLLRCTSWLDVHHRYAPHPRPGPLIHQGDPVNPELSPADLTGPDSAPDCHAAGTSPAQPQLDLLALPYYPSYGHAV